MTSYSGIPSIGTARVATDVPHFLGEGPTWDPIRARVLWVDIMAGLVYAGRLQDDGGIAIDERIEVGETAGAVAVASDGELVVAGTHRLVYVSPDRRVEAGRTLLEGDERRFNDGKPDPSGRFVVGTKGPGPELLLSIGAGEEVTVVDDDLTLSNGLAWTGDGRRMYSIDTGTRRIFVRDRDPETGATGERMLFAQFEHGYPDGMTVDAEDHVWVAVWGEGCVLRLAPSGAIVARVDVPAPHTSCPAFAGPDLATLVITTAREHLSEEQLAQHPHSGHLFTIEPGVTGVASALWSGIR